MQEPKAILALLLALWAPVSLTCHRITPHQMPVDAYEAIFLGRVTGIHLVGYENALAGKPDAYVDGMAINVKDGSAPVVVHAVPTTVHHGKVGRSVALQLVGCTTPLPGLKARGLFFVHRGAGSAVTVWESDATAFSYWLERLEVPEDER